LFAKSHLCSSPGVFIRPVEDGLGVGLLGEQDVVQDTSDLVCRCGDGLSGSELGTHAPEEFSEVALGTTQRISAKPKSKSSSAFHSARFTGQNLAAADAILWAETEPGCERRGVTEPMKIGTDLGQDDLRRNRADSGNIGKIDASDAIELSSKVEAGVVALTLKSRVLGTSWNFLSGLYGAGQSLHQALDFTVQLGNQLLAITVAIQ
jgi:hypothetical protein